MRPATTAKIPHLALLALLAGMQLVFWQESQDAFNPPELLWAKVLLPLGVIPLLITSWPGFANLFSSSAARLAGVWMAWLPLSAFLSPHPQAAFKNAVEFLLYTLLFFAPAVLDAPQRREALMAWMGACALAGLYGFFQHFGLDPWAWSTNFGGRPLGTMGNPNFFGGHMVMAWGASLGLFITAPQGKGAKWGLLLALLTAVQIFSWTVGVWLGMAFTAGLAAFLALKASRISRRQLLAGLGLALVLVGAAYSFQARRLKNEKSASVTNRLMMWKVAAGLWAEKPLQGAGLTEYRRRFPEIQAGILEKEKGWNYVVTWLPHQNFLYLLCELGLIGLGLFLSAWALSMAAAWRRLINMEAEAWAAVLAVAGMAGVSLLNTFSNIPASAMAFWFLLGLLAFRPRPALAKPAAASWNKALAFGAAVSLVLGLFAARELMAQRLLRQGLRHKKKGELQLAANYLRKAADMDIREFTPQTLVGVNYELAEVYRQGGAVELAAQAYARDLDENPHAPETHNMLGASLGQLGRTPESVEHLRQAIRLSPGYSAAMLNLGVAWVNSGNVSGAAGVWREVLKVDSANADARNYLDKVERKVR